MADTKEATKEELRARTHGDVCARCRKTFKPGHRVMLTHIVVRPGRNPNNLQAVGVFLSEEFEVIHIDCRDPLLRNAVKGI